MELNFATISAFVGIIGGILGILNQISGMRKQQEEAVRQQAVRDQKVDDRLKSIEARLDEHNNYAEKFASLTEAIIEMKTDVRWIKESKT